MIGITYAISFENIFTKIIALRIDTAEAYNFVILGAINILLFSLYFYYQKSFHQGKNKTPRNSEGYITCPFIT